MAANWLLFSSIFASFVIASVFALQCYQCGQYNEGVGSITPCINETYMKLAKCPREEHIYCLKYVSEGTNVRDCVPQCTEKEDWGAKTYCCMEDACNSAYDLKKTPCLVMALLGCFLAMVH